MATENPTALPGTDPNLLARFMAKVEITDGCWLWTGARKVDGYGYMIVNPRPDRRHITCHRLSWLMFRSTIPVGACVLHKCDNPPCVNPQHLFLGTRADNNRDKEAKGRGVRFVGSSHPNAKLTDATVREIRRLNAAGVRGKDIATRFGISRFHVSLLVRRVAWVHVL